MLAIAGLLLLPTPWNIAVVPVALAVEVGELLLWRRLVRHHRVRTGIEAMAGEPAQVVEACDPTGRVRFRGELWHARSAVPIRAGETARVAGIEGLTLTVEPAEAPTPGHPPPRAGGEGAG